MKLMSFIQSIDNAILMNIHNNMHSFILDKIMVLITSLGNGGLIWIIIGGILLLNKKYRKIGAMLIVSLILTTILGEGILKHIVQRLRPSNDILSQNMLISKPLSYSFPSGHTASAFAAAGILAIYFKKYAVFFFTLAALIAFSRLYLYVHYPTDVFAGMVLGLLCCKGTVLIFKKVMLID